MDMASPDNEKTVVSVPDEPSKNTPTHYVGIGASAGGLESIQAFFSDLPPKTGLAYVVVQHLSPDYKSLMVELLGKITEIPVQRAEEGMEVLPDHIYFIPPKKNMKIFHGRLLLNDQVRDSQTLNLPIDIFLTSLADDSRSKSIGIILSGAGSDGTRGCRAIKEVGGMVMVQDESSAKFNAMPYSVISSGLADFILPPSDMPKQLLAYANHPYTRDSKQSKLLDDKTGITRIFSLLREKSKIDFTFYKPSTIVRRIERRMTLNQTESLETYVAFLEGNPKEQNILYREMLIGVTCFFRDPDLFSLLSENSLPKSLQEFLGNEFRIWVAGCSTGEEAYTYAILCQEIMDASSIHKNVKIFATDVDQDALAKASTGIYPESIAADIPPSLLTKYFIKQGNDYRVIRQIREMVVFARHNLISDPPFTNIELVSCRNFLIYLQPVLQNRVIEGFNFSLSYGGILVLGSSESLGDTDELFETINPRWKIFKAKGNKKPLFQSDRLIHSGIGLYRRPQVSGLSDNGNLQHAHEEERLLGRFTDVLGNELVPFAMIIDDSMNLVYVVGDGRKYLNPPSGKVVNEVTKTVIKDLAIPLSTGLSKVFSASSDVNFTNVRINSYKERISVDVRIRVLPDQRGKRRLAAVFIFETGHFPRENITKDITIPDTYDLSREAEQRIRDLEQELQFTRENLQASIEELETSNEELQATNEELLASNEELQSTNEELQSVNEELFTVNAEYQNKITELTESNNDLDNFVNSTAVVSVFLDENLDIRRFTSSSDQVFNILNQDVGRPFEHISNKLVDVDILSLVKQVNLHGHDIVQEVKTSQGIWYQLKVLPYMISRKSQSGTVIVLHDINELKGLQGELLEATERYEMAQAVAKIGTWEWDVCTNELIWSHNIEPMFGMQKGQFSGKYQEFIDRVHPDDREYVERKINDAINNKSTYVAEHRVVWPDGETVIWVSETAQVEFDENNCPLRMTGLVREISDRRVAEEALKYSKDLLNNILSTAPTGIGLLHDRVFEWINPKAEEILGYTDSELRGESTKKLYTSTEAYEQAGEKVYNLIATEGSSAFRTQWVKKDGNVIDVLLSAKPVGTPTGDVRKAVIFTVMETNELHELNGMCPLDETLCPLTNMEQEGHHDHT